MAMAMWAGRMTGTLDRGQRVGKRGFCGSARRPLMPGKFRPAGFASPLPWPHATKLLFLSRLSLYFRALQAGWDRVLMQTILVTGGAGFIGSAVIRLLMRETRATVVNLDKLTYAANPLALEGAEASPRYRFEQADIADGEAVRAILARHQPDAIMHLAAETHVDRSIDGPADFIRTNILGTYALLEAAR